MFQIGDRVVTTELAFEGNPEADKYRGVKGQIVGTGFVFPWEFQPDVLVDDEPITWLMNTDELVHASE